MKITVTTGTRMKKTLLNKFDKEFLIECLKKGKEIPEEYKYALFPTIQKEYELTYAGKRRKEDVIADNEEAKAVPLQIEKVFNEDNQQQFGHKDWQNLLVFGDNLQVLKTFYRNHDPLVKGKIKGKVKLVYIDPPFGTGDEYDGNKGQSAYSAKRKGADYVEFVRRRLILLRELLADDGLIFVRQGFNFDAYIKVVLDEVFGKGNFLNEIIVNRGKQRLGGKRKFSTATDLVYLYAKSDSYDFYSFKRPRYASEAKGTNMLMKGWRNPPERIFIDPDGKKVQLLPPTNQHWKFVQPKIDEMYRKGLIYLAESRKGKQSGITKIANGKKVPVSYVPSFNFDDDKTVDSNWSDISGYSQSMDYPTENSEALLERVIKTGTQKGDLVLDCFAGSGSTLAVAEKLGRRWIGCDIGKLAIYTTQKRLLEIESSNNLENPKVPYRKKAKTFAVASSGLYDLGKVFALRKDEYVKFVNDLFEIEETTTAAISGVQVDGKKNGYYVKIFPYWDLQNISVDEKYLAELHKNIGAKVGERFYIIAPANNIDFISDYHPIDNVHYYFLKVPYQIIRELHKVQFRKLRQPQSKKSINELDEAIGFHFIRQPEVKSAIEKNKEKLTLSIKKFESGYAQDENGKSLGNFESLAMLLLDYSYDGEKFVMDECIFADDLTKEDESSEGEIRQALSKRKAVGVTLPGDRCGNQLMVIYVDIYGNEFREVIQVPS